MRAFEIMTEGVHTVSADLAADEAWETMSRNRIHHLVAMRGQEIAGVLSDRDAGGRSGAAVRAGRTVADLMTPQVVTAAPADTIRSLANLMRGRTIGCVPIVDRRRLVGIVTLADLLRVIGRGVDRPAKPARRMATHRVPHRKRHANPGAW
jgi:CBS domain-containing protein